MRVKCLAQEHNTMTRPGLEPGPLDPKSSVLTVRPPLLPPRDYHGRLIPKAVVTPLRIQRYGRLLLGSTKVHYWANETTKLTNLRWRKRQKRSIDYHKHKDVGELTRDLSQLFRPCWASSAYGVANMTGECFKHPFNCKWQLQIQEMC